MLTKPYADPQSPFCLIVDKSQGFWWGFYKSLKLENNDAMVCKNPRIFWRQYVGYIDTVRHARDYKVKYVVATSGFFIELCQEVVVKGFKDSSYPDEVCDWRTKQ